MNDPARIPVEESTAEAPRPAGKTALGRRALAAIILLQAIAIVALAFAVVYYGRDEFRSGSPRQGEGPAAASRVDSAGGAPVLRLAREVQAASGISSVPLKAATLTGQTQAFGSVLALDSLVELRSRYNAALNEVKVQGVALAASRADYQRMLALFRDDRTVSERALKSAEAEWKAAQAKRDAAQSAVTSLRSEMRSHWGETLADWAAQGNEHYSRLARNEEALLRITFGFEQLAQRQPEKLSVAAVGQEARSMDAALVSAAPQSDPALAGQTFFYRVPGRELRAGMRVVAQLPQAGESRQGVIVPQAALVWHGGKAWVYLQRADGAFARVEVSAEQPAGDGWFNSGNLKAGSKVVVSGAQLLLSEEFRYQIKNENED